MPRPATTLASNPSRSGAEIPLAPAKRAVRANSPARRVLLEREECLPKLFPLPAAPPEQVEHQDDTRQNPQHCAKIDVSHKTLVVSFHAPGRSRLSNHHLGGNAASPSPTTRPPRRPPASPAGPKHIEKTNSAPPPDGKPGVPWRPHCDKSAGWASDGFGTRACNWSFRAGRPARVIAAAVTAAHLL